MLIGLTGQRGIAQHAIADYLMRSHAFVRADRVNDTVVDELAAHDVLVLSVDSLDEAQQIYARGGVLVHIPEPGLPNFGPCNGIELREADRVLTITRDYFRAFDQLDALIGSAAFSGAPA